MRNMFGSHTSSGEFRGYVDSFGNVCDSTTKLPVGRITQFGVQDSNGRPVGISQEALAELTGLHRTYISDIERGSRNVAILNIVRLAKALKVNPADLVDGFEK